MRFSPVEEAQATLAKLLEIYWRGLSRALPFFPESALNYANAKLSPPKNTRSHAVGKSASGLERLKMERRPAEKNDLYYAFCFPDRDPLNEEFISSPWKFSSRCFETQRSIHESASAFPN